MELKSERKKRKGTTLTVMTAPISTIAKLNDCCVARATFSFPVSSDQRSRPSSEMTVICLRVGPEADPSLPCVA